MGRRHGRAGVMPPFIIFSLPRSRSFWLSRFLSGDGSNLPCGHDIGAMVESLPDAKEALIGALCGTVETGAAGAWRWLRKNLPEARFVVVRRPIEEVEESLTRCGLQVPRSVLALQSAWLDEISAQYGTVTIEAAWLDRPEACAALFRLCRGIDCSAAWLALNVGANIQLDMAHRVSLLQSRHLAIEGIRAEAQLADLKLRGYSLPFVQMGAERWSDEFERDVLPLAREHFDEANHDSEERRPFGLDCEVLRQTDALGLLQLNVARVDGQVAAYCLWTIGRDPESSTVTTAMQGPWFVRRCPEFRGLKLGTTLFRRSLSDLKSRGVRCVYPHHPTHGRGAELGAFFERIGAVEMQRVYSLWIGD